MSAPRLGPAFWIAAAILFVSAAGLNAAISALRIHLRKLPIEAPGGRKVQAIPAETASWKRLMDIVEKPEIVTTLGTENYLTRVFVQKPDAVTAGERPKRADLHLAYYTGSIDTVPHVPERCMVGGGWSIVGDSVEVGIALDRSDWREDRLVPAAFAGRVWTARTSLQFSDEPGRRVRLPKGSERVPMRITEFADGKAGRRMFAGYFFLANGGLTSSAEGVRQLAFDLRTDYAYYLKVQVSSPDADSPASLADLAGSLLSELLPEVMRCVPDWVAVESGQYPLDRSAAVEASTGLKRRE
ncbi:MAG: exosortase-associated EpsI family protein [Phycisphaerae bacterium]|nr:exosortase-associated EpsI family protein [Phycisphaerae bacterium]